MTDMNAILLLYALPLTIWWMVRLTHPYDEEERACLYTSRGAQIIAIFAAISGAMLGYRYLDASLLWGAVPAALWATVLKSQVLWRLVIKSG